MKGSRVPVTFARHLWMQPSLVDGTRQAGCVDVDLARRITGELRAFVAAAGTRRALPTTCHIGHPGGERVPLAAVDEASLRADLVERAIDGLRDTNGACAWVTRGGYLGTTDADAAWFAAAREGYARHGLTLPAFVVVTRTAWLDLVGGQRRVWRRVRNRSRGSARRSEDR